MKLKYYMRGVGIGVVVTTIILVIAFSFAGSDMSDKDVIERAKKLGMVEGSTTMTNATTNNTSNSSKNGTGNATEVEGNQTIPGATGPMPDNNTTQNSTANITPTDSVEFTISDGDVSRTVIERLVAMGLVSDYDSFNRYLNEKGLDHNLQNGTFKIKKGISQEELANLLVTKQQFREQ